jgi:hypothetical protein
MRTPSFTKALPALALATGVLATAPNCTSTQTDCEAMDGELISGVDRDDIYQMDSSYNKTSQSCQLEITSQTGGDRYYLESRALTATLGLGDDIEDAQGLLRSRVNIEAWVAHVLSDVPQNYDHTGPFVSHTFEDGTKKWIHGYGIPVRLNISTPGAEAEIFLNKKMINYETVVQRHYPDSSTIGEHQFEINHSGEAAKISRHFSTLTWIMTPTELDEDKWDIEPLRLLGVTIESETESK